jgi:predicted P-loop ATPase
VSALQISARQARSPAMNDSVMFSHKSEVASAAERALQKLPADLPTVISRLCQPEVTTQHIGYDDFSAAVSLAPYDATRLPADKEGLEWRELTDADYVELRLILQRDLGFKAVSRDLIRDAVSHVADKARFDSAQDWLLGVNWDKVPRIDRFLIDYCGAPDTPYVRACGAYLWTALAGRVMQPGAKADMVIVLVGPQGVGKSRLIESLVVHADWYGTLNLADRDDDTGRLMAGKLVVELAELRGMRQRDAESMKAFLSATDDRWVPKYKEKGIRQPRRCLFIGSSNVAEFLTDETGNRRWLPVEVTQCNPDTVRHDCELLWAEARERYCQGGIEFAEAERLARAVHADYSDVDAWQSEIVRYLDGDAGKRLDAVTMDQLFKALLLESARDKSRANQTRIGKIMANLGWKRCRKARDERGTRPYEYRRPEVSNDGDSAGVAPLDHDCIFN